VYSSAFVLRTISVVVVWVVPAKLPSALKAKNRTLPIYRAGVQWLKTGSSTQPISVKARRPGDANTSF
jgi:hypothetical protein